MRRAPLIGFLLVAACLRAQQFPFLSIDHSPKNIERILEDRQGRLWIATHDDVLCFDGSHFFSLHDFGFPPVTAYSLIEDADGGILSGSPLGIHRFYRGRLEHVLSGLSVDEMVEVAPHVFLATGYRSAQIPAVAPYRIRAIGQAWRAEELAGWRIEGNLTRDRAGTVLAACPGGWCEISARMVVDWSPGRPGAPIFHRSALSIDRIVRDRFGCLWFRSAEAGAYQCPGDSKPVPLAAAIAGRNVWAAETETPDGAMLLANAGSVALGRPGAFQVISPANGLPAEVMTSAVRLRDGSIWAGSIGGLYRFPYPFRLTYWKSRHGLVWSFAKSRGRLFTGTSAGVAWLGRDGTWSVMPGSRDFGSVGSLLPEADGTIYAAVSGEAVIQLRPDGSLAARTPPERGGGAETLARTSDGSIWLAGSGIYRVLKKGRELSLAPENPPEGPPPHAYIASDPSGTLWGCFGDTVMRRDGANWRTIARNGLPQQQCRSLVPLENGDTWIGYTGGPTGGAIALVHPASGSARLFPSGSGGDIGLTNTFSLASDTRGWLWRGSGDGIYVADRAQAEVGLWLHLNEADGLTDLDVNHGSIFSDPDGSVWWAAATSILHFYPPPDLVHPAAPPVVFLSAFSLNGGPPKLAEAIGELPGRQRLTAHLGSLQFAGRDGLRLRYRLLPGQKDWRESAALDLDLGTPWRGTHTLEIQSRFRMGDWSPTLRREFVVLPPWWFSWPAILAFAGIGAGGGVGAVAWRRKLDARAKTTLPDLAEMRMSVLTPESQLVGAMLDRVLRFSRSWREAGLPPSSEDATAAMAAVPVPSKSSGRACSRSSGSLIDSSRKSQPWNRSAILRWSRFTAMGFRPWERLIWRWSTSKARRCARR